MAVLWLNITATTHVVADLKSVIDSMVASFGTRFGPQMSNAFSITAAKASWLYAAGNSIEYVGTYSTPGSIANAAISDSAAAVINWSITDYYRGGHPRTYLAGIPANHMASGRLLDNTERTNIATGATGFLTDVNALTHGGISAVALGTVRFASGNAWLSPPVFRAYQSASVRAVLGTQRRRYAA